MTDKQIIIDEMIEKIGFDVQQCGYLEIIEDAPNYPEIGGTYTAFECNLYCRDCKFINDCRYKQLLRKEQECERLKKIIVEARESKLDLKSFLVGEAIQNEYEQQLDQLKQTLTEIKDIAVKSDMPPCLKNDCICEKCKDKITENGSRCMQYGLEKILQKISEVLE
jgi:hypothetical protein